MIIRIISAVSFYVVALMVTSCGNSHGKIIPDQAVMHSDTGKAELVFREFEHDFGKVAQGEKVGYAFHFDNKGTSDLIIYAATASCGCTVPKYDSKPIHPGGDGKIEVVFDTSGRNGTQTKNVTIRSNASVPVVNIRITATVEAGIN